MENKQLNEDYSKFEKVSINNIKGLLTKKSFEKLINDYNILTLEELFVQMDSGELYQKNKNAKFISEYQRGDFWLNLNSVVNLLRYKYFGDDLSIDENMEREEYFKVLGFSVHDGYTFRCAKLNTLSQLLNTVKNNDFTPIFSMGFQEDKNEAIINRIKIAYNFLYGIKEENQETEFISRDLDISRQELFYLYDELKKRIEESRELDLQIANLNSKIEQQKDKIKSLIR